MEVDLAQLGSEETAPSDSGPDNRFVPLTPDDLIAQLTRDAQRFGCTGDELAAVFTSIRDVVEQEGAACHTGERTCFFRQAPNLRD